MLSRALLSQKRPFSDDGNSLIYSEIDQQRECVRARTFPTPDIASLMASKQIGARPQYQTYLLSRLTQLKMEENYSEQYIPENTLDFWKENPFHCWVFPDLFQEKFKQIIAKPESSLQSSDLKAIQNILYSITKKDFWVDLIHVSPDSFEDVLFGIVKLSKDPKLGKAVKTFINDMRLLPIQIVNDNSDLQPVSWKDLNEEKVKLT
eukprot:UN22919